MHIKRTSQIATNKSNRKNAKAVRLQYGALPYRIGASGELELLLVTSRGRGRWIIPKGWPIKGLTPRKAAAREAFEEAGIRGKIGAKPIGHYPYAKLSDDESGAISCEVLVFALEVKRQLKDWPEASEREVRWMGARAAADLIDDEGLRRVVEAFAQRKRHETSLSALKGANRKASVPAPKVVVTNWVDEDTLEPLRRLGANVVANQCREPWPDSELRAQLGDADVMIAFMPDRIDADLLQAAPRLKLIGCALKGYDNFDLAACRARNVAVTIVKDLLTVPTAELTIGAMIALGRHVLEADAFVRSGRHRGWRPQYYGTGLAGSSIGFLGFGAIACAMAKRLRAFECARLLAYDLQPPTVAGVSAATAEQVLSESDFIVLAMSLNDGARHFVNRDRLNLVKPGALLINPARGSLVDEAAVVDALEGGNLGGYAADVFAFEDWAWVERPPAIDQRLLALRDRTLLTPHLGSAVVTVRRRIAEAAIKSAVAFLSGKPLQGRVI